MTETELFRAVHEYARTAECGGVPLVFGQPHVVAERAKLLETIRKWSVSWATEYLYGLGQPEATYIATLLAKAAVCDAYLSSFENFSNEDTLGAAIKTLREMQEKAT